MSKKDKKSIAKRNAKAQERKKQKRKLQLLKMKHKLVVRPPDHDQRFISEIEAPPGYQAISSTQAIMAYSKALLDWDNFADLAELNHVMAFTSSIWNLGIDEEQNKVDPRARQKVLKMIEDLYKVDEDEAQELLVKFMGRRRDMFPPEIQIPGSRYMYMRKEISTLIAPFNYSQLQMTDEIPPIDDTDRDFISRLKKLEDLIFAGRQYLEWEEECLDLEKLCQERFSNWLLLKGVPNDLAKEFSFYIEVFMNFVYRYAHEDEIAFESVRPEYFEEFLFDHALRKVMLEPQQHVLWPPALKLFYRFLFEKGYLKDPGAFIGVIDDLERQFLDGLRERYG